MLKGLFLALNEISVLLTAEKEYWPWGFQIPHHILRVEPKHHTKVEFHCLGCCGHLVGLFFSCPSVTSTKLCLTLTQDRFS